MKVEFIVHYSSAFDDLRDDAKTQVVRFLSEPQ